MGANAPLWGHKSVANPPKHESNNSNFQCFQTSNYINAIYKVGVNPLHPRYVTLLNLSTVGCKLKAYTPPWSNHSRRTREMLWGSGNSIEPAPTAFWCCPKGKRLRNARPPEQRFGFKFPIPGIGQRIKCPAVSPGGDGTLGFD